MSETGDSPIRIAVIGTGLIGPRHARSVAGCSDAALTCLIDPNPLAQQVADEFCVPLYPSVKSMLEAQQDVEAAIVCTPNSTHVAVGQELLEAGIHVLVEKPVATDVESGQGLVGTATLHQRQLLVGHHRRFNPYVAAAKRTLEQGVIGRPVAISGLWALCKPESYFAAPTQWRAQKGQGGPILINLIHEIDILHYLLGPIVRVHAEQTVSQRTHDVEEGAAILLRFSSGVVGTFVLSDAVPSAHNWESGTGENPTIPHSGRDFYRIFGTDGTLSVGDMKVTKYAAGVEKSWTSETSEVTVQVGDEIPFDEQVKHFVRVVRGEEQPRCSGDDALRALRVCDAVRQALENGVGVVDIPENTWH